MRHKNGRMIFGVSREQLARDGGAYVAPRQDRNGVVLIGVGSGDFPGSGWMPADRVEPEAPHDPTAPTAW